MGRILFLAKFISIFIFVVAILLLSAGKTFAASIRPSESFYTNSLSEMLIKPYMPIAAIKVPVLVYHYIEYVNDPDDPTRKLLATEPHILDQQIKTLLDNGFEFINFKDLEDYFEGAAIPPKKPIMLTFDDGYEDFYSDAFPIISKYKVKSIQYVISGAIGKPNYMNQAQIREVMDSGLVEIGAHTVDHFNLLKLSPSDSLIQIKNSKEDLEKKFGIKVSSFAYPYGHHSPLLEEQAQRIGYGTAVTMDKGYTIRKNERFAIKRIKPGIALGDDLIRELFSVDN